MKLTDIKKKNIYTTPDKYFDQLPTRIQNRVNIKNQVTGSFFNWNMVLKVASPAIAVILIVFYISIDRNKNGQSAEDLLAQIATDDLIAYLVTTDISTEEIIEELDLASLDLDFGEDGFIMQDMDMKNEDIEMLFEEYELDGDLL